MNITTKIVTNKQEWEAFLKTQDPAIYVQSWNYGEFNKLEGDDFFVLGLYRGEKLIGGSLLIHIHAKRGDFLYAPYGPLLKYKFADQVEIFTQAVKAEAEKRKVAFVRISPFQEDSPELRELMKQNGFRKAPMHMIAETTRILPLSEGEVDLLKHMKQNHRNLIRRAKREGVVIKTSDSIEDVKKVHELLKATSKRHHFIPFSLKYLEREFKAFDKINGVRIYLAYYQDELLAASIVYFYGDTVVYKHGASNMKHPKIPASYAIQWQAIQDGLTRNFKYYNFWGIAPKGNKKHPYYGITHFKKGFGGYTLDLLPAHDLIITPKYWFNWLIETFRRLKRGF